MRRIFLCAAAALALAAIPCGAERADREKEIVVGADRLLGDDVNRTSTFEGNVVVTQGTMRMTANKVTVKEDPERHKYYIAYGAPVTFRQKRDNVDEWVEGYAERAEFDDRNEVLKLFNHARVKQNTNEITGDFISYDMRQGVVEVSAAPGKSPTEASRVKGVLLPPKKSPDADKGGKAGKAGKSDEAPALELKPDTGTP
jgi:lipopolysaccharide export system protein LptA